MDTSITVDTTLADIFDRKKSNSFLSLNRFQKPPSCTLSLPVVPPSSSSTEQNYNRIFSVSKPPLPRQVECLQAFDRDNYAIPRAKSEGSVSSCHGDGSVVLRRRSATSQVTAELLEQRRQSRLSRVSVTSGIFDFGNLSKRNSIASSK